MSELDRTVNYTHPPDETSVFDGKGISEHGRPWTATHKTHTHTRRNVLTASVCGYISGNLPQSTSYRSFQIFFPLASLSS
jgi:hypothetical protein